MKLPFTKPAPESVVRQRPQVSNRTQSFSYHAYRSADTDVTGRRLFRDVITVEKASRTAKYWARRVGVLAVVIAVGSSVISMLLLTPDPKILPLDPSQAHFMHDTATYEAAARKLFTGSIASRTKLTIDRAGISLALMHEFPDLASVSVKLPLIGHRPIVYIAPETAVLMLEATDGATYIVGQNGEAIAPGAATGSTLPRVKDDSGTSVRPGQPILATSTIAFIHAILFQLAQKQILVSTFVLPANSSELDMYVDGQHYFVKFNLASDTPLEQVGAFLAVQHNLAGQGVTPGQYIDVRVEGRAYYK